MTLYHTLRKQLNAVYSQANSELLIKPLTVHGFARVGVLPAVYCRLESSGLAG